MVVLAVCICTRGGKILLARIFAEIKSDIVKMMISNFSNLICNTSYQHTMIEDDNFRFVYNPLEELFITLITNKKSNILEDIKILNIFSSVVGHQLRIVDESEVYDKSFDIISAFDEIVNSGYNENLFLSQIQTYLEMNSHEEKIQKIIQKNKELEAAEERKKRAKEIQRKELYRKNSIFFEQIKKAGPNDINEYQELSNYSAVNVENMINLESHSTFNKIGLQLGKKTLKPSFGLVSANKKDDARNYSSGSAPRFIDPKDLKKRSTSKCKNNGVLIIINETFMSKLTRDGMANNSEIKGDLQLRVNNPSYGNLKIVLDQENKSDLFKFKTHPNVDSNLFNSKSLIELKDKSKHFPQNDQELGVLKWRASVNDKNENFFPFLVTSWININDKIANVTLEYELTKTFVNFFKKCKQDSILNLKFFIPVFGDNLELTSSSNDDLISYEMTDAGLMFVVSSIDLNDPQGSFGFKIPIDNEDLLFPITLQFDFCQFGLDENKISFGGIKVLNVLNVQNEEPFLYDFQYNFTLEDSKVL